MNGIKKVMLLGTAYPYRGGLASFNEKLARMFADRGTDVRLYTFTVQYPSFFFPGKSQYSESLAPLDLDIERVVNSVNPFNWIRVGRRIRREKPDVVVVRYWLPFMAPCLGTICRIARKNGHTKIIALLDNVVPHEKRALDVAFTKYFTGSVDGFIYMSAQVKSDLDRFTTSKPSLFSPHPLYDIYGSPVDRKKACETLKLDPGFGYSLFFGFVREYKGLDLLIDAWGIMKSKEKLAGRKLIVAGEYYSDKDKYREQIRRCGVEDDVILFDYFVRDDDVRYFFSAADLVVQPYKSATQSGITQIAYSFDVPMVVTAVGGLAETVPDKVVGYVVKPDAEAIAGAITEFYEGGHAQEFRRNMAQEKKRFSWDAMTDSFSKLYDTLKKQQEL